jgi:hypothetical protein
MVFFQLIQHIPLNLLNGDSALLSKVDYFLQSSRNLHTSSYD